MYKLKRIIIFTLILCFIYLICSFIYADFDFTNWDFKFRLMVGIFGPVLAGALSDPVLYK